MFSWHGPNPDSLSIMTFSEIGPGSRKSNAFDRCLSLQLQKKKNQDTPSERDRRSTWRERKLAIAVFRAKAIGEYQVLPVISATSPLSKHLQTRMHMQSRERVWRAHAVTKLITRKYILEKLPASPDRLQTRRAGQEVKIK